MAPEEASWMHVPATMTRLFPYLVVFLTGIATLTFLFHQSKASMSTIKERRKPETEYDVVYSPLCDEKRKLFRTRFSRGPGVSVRGWPSKGGIYILERCFNIELDFLKLDRYHDTPRPPLSDPEAVAEEEAHCNRMRQLGAVWWPSESDWGIRKIEQSVEQDPDDPFIKVGWPAGGGVWVLNLTDDEAIERGVAIIYNASDMEHQCRLIEQLGGIFYKNPKDWLDLDLP